LTNKHFFQIFNFDQFVFPSKIVSPPQPSIFNCLFQ
jgi:hypothetical protein